MPLPAERLADRRRRRVGVRAVGLGDGGRGRELRRPGELPAAGQPGVRRPLGPLRRGGCTATLRHVTASGGTSRGGHAIRLEGDADISDSILDGALSLGEGAVLAVDR